MSKTITPDVTAEETRNYEAAVEQMFIEMKQANEKLARDQAEIDKLKAETRAIIERLPAA